MEKESCLSSAYSFSLKKRIYRLRSLFLLFLFIFSFHCDKKPFDPKIPKASSISLAPIPPFVRTDSLILYGTAHGYTTLYCDNGLKLFSDYITELGKFSLKIPAIKEKINILKIYAHDIYHQASDTIIVSFVHTLDNFVHLNDVPHFTNADSIAIEGNAFGFSIIFCEKAGFVRSDSLRNNFYFLIKVPLAYNSENRLIFFAQDALGNFSDTTIVDITHDNIPPKIIFSNVKEDSLSYNIHAKPYYQFDSPIGDFNVQFNDYKFDDITFLDNSTTLIMNLSSSLYVGTKYSIQFSVQDSAGNTLQNADNFKTYYKYLPFNISWMSPPKSSSDNTRIFLPGIRHITADDEYVLAILDCSNWSLNYVGLPKVPYCAAENPTNGLVYVTTLSNDVILVDPNQASITQIIQIPEINASAIDFFRNGIGVLSSADFGWNITIDTQNGNEIRAIKEISDHHLYPVSFNQRKDILLYQQGMISSETPIFHMNDQENRFTRILKNISINPAQEIRGHAMKYSFIINGGHLVDENLNIYSIGLSNPVDFTYLPGEDSKVYFVNAFELWDKIGLADLKSGEIDVRGDCQAKPSNVFTTIDGKYLIMISKYANAIFIIEPKTFR